MRICSIVWARMLGKGLHSRFGLCWWMDIGKLHDRCLWSLPSHPSILATPSRRSNIRHVPCCCRFPPPCHQVKSLTRHYPLGVLGRPRISMKNSLFSSYAVWAIFICIAESFWTTCWNRWSIFKTTIQAQCQMTFCKDLRRTEELRSVVPNFHTWPFVMLSFFWFSGP